MNKYGLIYKVVNTVNGKIYIGQTTRNINLRINAHNSSGFCLHSAINKYGKENFIWSILEHCDSKEELDEMEFHYIKQYNSLAPNGYNLTLGGDGVVGLHHSDETKLKISRAKYGVSIPKLSEEHKLKIGAANRGHRHSKESRIKMTESRVGRYVGEDSWRAKQYVVEFTDGKKYKINSLRNFCKIYFNNIDMFYKGLSAVAVGKRNHHKGYKCRFYDSELDSNIKEFIYHKDT